MKTKLISAAMVIIGLIYLLAFYGCNESSAITNTETSGSSGTGGEVPAIYSKLYGAYDMYVDGDYLVVKTKDLPDHGSPYYTGSGYEAYNGNNQNFNLNPNRIREQDITLRIPLNPTEASNHQSTPMGVIGVSLNGVPFFNQYAAGGVPLTGEINSFDQYNGHPQMTGLYHYHIEPTYLTQAYGRDALLGYLLDGFPVYGPEENGQTLTNSDLDEYHGHFGPTADYPDGIYHYHITDEAPYLNGDGFYGVPGTVSQ
ncbi:MAG: YHYH protein [Ignavibacteriae bacterium]|nr:YHYH protein [Ignavibacteriota bacterium]MCB9242596.1 YHYH protein [Ignavibacteriales bacterium]